MKNQKLTAILFTSDSTVLKYRNIINYSHDPGSFYNPKFISFCGFKQTVTINLYDKDSKQFFKQIKL